VFAPPARAEKAALVEIAATPADTAEAFIEAIFAKSPALEADVAKLASGF
jgi:electron transfer flavoprotein beta subunit